VTDFEFDNNIALILSGNKEGLKNIYSEYISFIYKITYNVLLHKADAEDVTSEFFIKLWNISDKYKSGNGHKVWLAQIARNMAIDYARKHKKEQLSDDIITISDTNPHSPPDKQYENEVLDSIMIEQTLSCLKEKERQIIDMKILGDFTFKEIAKVLNLPMGTVTWRYQNAIKKLQKQSNILNKMQGKEVSS
jgi:RNA polymerase sigma-70 factor (ECF subfamily)